MSRKKSFRSHRHKVPKKVLQVRWLRKLYAISPNVRKLTLEKFHEYAE